ncbi:MAG: HlyC/CorC family transporter [Alphaproteobacteria bacterium]|nr:HlyC/CorC family transporter [Alphaproteobacteria bacterium]
MTYDAGIALLSILGLIIVSAFFSASETGLTTASRARLTELEKRGSKRASMVLKMTALPERLIGALLLGNSLANITASAVATAALVKVFNESGAVIASVVMTVLILIFAEVMPKTYAIAYPDRVAAAVAPVMRIIVAVLAPIVMTVEYIVKKTLMLFGVDTSNVDGILSAHDELRGAIDLHHKEGTFVKKDKDMLGGILDLKDLEVADVMIHRTKMQTIDGSEPIQAIVQQVLKSGNTRLPVWKDDPENFIGVLHAKNLFAAIQQSGGDLSKVKLDDVLTPPWFVPDTRPLNDQLNAFLRRKGHFALVVDEYGEVQGLITLEDIVEEIVGDIKDEFDAVTTGVRKQKDGSYNIEGTVPVRDLNRSFDWSLPDDEVTTIAGLVIHEARMIPDQGQIFNFHGFRFEVLKKRKQQLALINVLKLEAAPHEAEQG